MPVTILLVDDHPLFRKGIASLLGLNPRYRVVGEAASRTEALELARILAPQLILLDLTLGKDNGLELLKDLQVIVPESRVLVLSMHDEEIYAERVLAAGASGYVEKNEASERVLEAIEVILSGRRWLSPVLRERWEAGAVRSLGTEALVRLSDRELEVFTLMGRGWGTSRIAGQLNLSVRTIETHQDHLKQKLGCASTQELRIRATGFPGRGTGEPV